MGNTIRREPVSFGMPAAPDYKFLNITNFGGIHQSENPFLTENNTASDCLNVYVDETNTLTTRPRLEKKTDYFKNLEGFNKILYTYPLFEKQVFQVSFSDGVKFYVRKDGVFNEITGATFTENKSAVLEQDNKIYIMNNNYYVVKSDYVARLVSEDDETYVPTTQLGSILGVDNVTLSDYEEENLLTNKFYKKFTWDGVSPLQQAVGDGSIKTNGFVREVTHRALDSDSDNWLYGCGNNIFLEKKSKSYWSSDPVEKEGWVRFLTVTESGALIKGDKIPLTGYTNADISNTLTPTSNGSCLMYRSGTKLKILSFPALEEKLDIDYSNTLGSLWVYKDNIFYDDSSGVLFILGYDTTDTSKYTLVKYTKNGDSSVVYSNDNTGPARIDGMRFAFNSDFTSCMIYSENYKAVLIDFSDDDASSSVVELTSGKKYFLSDGRSYVNYKPKTEQDKSEIILYVYDSTQMTYNEQKLYGQTDNYKTESELLSLVENSSGVYVIESHYDISRDEYHDAIRTNGIAYAYYLPTNTSRKGFYVGCVDYHDYYANLRHSTAVSGKVFMYCGTYAPHYYYGYIIRGLFLSTEPLLVVEYLADRNTEFKFTGVVNFRNKNWFYGDDNMVRWTAENDPTYLPTSNYDKVGLKDDPILDALPISDYALILIKREGKFVLSYGSFGDYVTELITESKSAIGGVSAFGSVVAEYNELPIYLSPTGIYCLRQKENISPADFESLLLSERISKKLEEETDKEKAHTTSIRYWSLFTFPKETTTDVFLLDGRTNNWFYWSVPVSINRFWKENDKLCCCSYDGEIYSLETSDIITEVGTEYYDDGGLIIPWFWRSQILHLGTMNYSKKLNTTTFIMIDSDSTDEYGLNYKFKIFRKLASESNATTISNRLNYIQSITKKTIIPRFNFLQFEVSNIENDTSNNKLRMVGLGLKYELLAGLM